MSSQFRIRFPGAAHPVAPPWVPQRPPDVWTLTEVVKHVKTAMMIELTTIPLYLYAAYSIDITSSNLAPNTLAAGQDTRKKILGVVVQEMLHLALSGNLLCALDGTTELYDFQIIPQFPGTILYEKVEMNLNRADQANLTDFKEIEQPVDPNQFRVSALNALASSPGVLPEYRSIGEFYENLKQGLATLTDDHLKHNPDYQFTPQEWPHLSGMAVINDQTIAQDSLELIIEQGEGGPETKDSHYSTYSQLSSQPPSWNLFNVRKNPKTVDYKGLGTPPNFAYKLSLAFDAGYCYLLQNIQRVWGRGGNDPDLHKKLAGNMVSIMRYVMPPLADILVHQPLTPSSSEVAAPCFNYYPFKEDGEPDTPLEPEDLQLAFVNLLMEAATLATQSSQTTQYVQTLGSLSVTVKALTPRP